MPLRFRVRESGADLERCQLHRSPHVLVAVQGDESVLLDAHGERYYTLNDVGNHVWSQLAAPTTLAQIVASVHESYDVPLVEGRDPVAHDVACLLRHLLATHLVVAGPITTRKD